MDEERKPGPGLASHGKRHRAWLCCDTSNVVRSEPPTEAMTTIVAPTPFVGQVIDSLRLAYDWSAGRGVPAHLTLLGPFLGPDDERR
jgi:hypothetical protein